MEHQIPDPLWQNAFHVTFLPVPTHSHGSMSFPNQLSLLLQVCVSNQFLEDRDPGNPLESLLNLGNVKSNFRMRPQTQTLQEKEKVYSSADGPKVSGLDQRCPVALP